MGLSERAVLTRGKKKDESIEWDDVKFPENDLGLALWDEQEKKSNRSNAV